MKNNRLRAFDNFEVQPSDGVWKAIEKQLPARKKKRWLIWLFSFIAAAGLVFILMGDRHASNIAINPTSGTSVEQKTNTGNVAERSVQNDIINTTKSSNDIIKSENDNHDITNTPSYSNTEIEKKANSIAAVRTQKRPTIAHNSITHADASFTNVDSENRLPSVQPADRELLPIENLSLASINRSMLTMPVREKTIHANQEVSSTKSRLIRWSAFMEAGYIYSNLNNMEKKIENSPLAKEGVKSSTFGAGISFDASSRWRFSIGFNTITKGALQDAQYKIILNGVPQNTNNTYTIVTAGGNITGFGSEFDEAFFNSPDSILFVPTAQASPSASYEETRSFTIRSEFNYIDIPVSVIYKFREGKITPYAGAVFSAGFLTSYDVSINGTRIGYDYQDGINHVHYSAGLTAGLELSINRKLGFYASGLYRSSLRSITKGKNEFHPFITGITGGLRYRFSAR